MRQFRELTRRSLPRAARMGAVIGAIVVAVALAVAIAPSLAGADVPPVSLFTSATGTPSRANADRGSIEVGVRFTTAVGGSVTALRYFKPAGSPAGQKTGHLWSSSGKLLAAVTFTSESASGWQEASLGTPVSLSPGATYVASYFAPNGGYASTSNFFSSGSTVSGPLSAPSSQNGVYTYASRPAFPTTTYRKHPNYWADLVFVPASEASTTTTSTTTTTTSTTTTTTPMTTTTTQPPATPTSGDPTPSFVACGPNHSSAMDSPYTTFAAAKTAFPNTAYVDVPAGDNFATLAQNWMIDADTTYFFEPGVHTLGLGQYNQIIPKDNDVFVGAPGAVLDGQDSNAYAFTQHATGVTVKFLEVRHFVAPLDEGVVNHDAGANWTMSYNYMHDNGGAALFLGDGNTAGYNCLDHNAQYGFQIFGTNVDASYNEISRNDSANVESSNPGCGCSGGMKAWGAKNVVLDNNWVHDNMNVGLWADTNNVGFDISNNVITDNSAEAIIYETSYNFHIANNYLARNAWVKGTENPGFPNPAIYISESGGDARVGSLYATSEIANNTLVDNWGGVTLWENANRYCGVGIDHECTLVNPTVATMSSCSTTQLATTPYINDCRWKTQNINVRNNKLTLTRANIPNCTAANDCGDEALISQYGTCGGPCSPGDPYMGTFVEDNITFHQNNHFTNNTYVGPWRFEIHEQNSLVSFGTWQSATYNQDAGSTLSP